MSFLVTLILQNSQKADQNVGKEYVQ